MRNIELRLKHLRQDWLKYPNKRASIELQARIIKLAAEKTSDYHGSGEEQLLLNVAETLI